MTTRRVLLVEDDSAIARIIRFYLEQQQDFNVTWAETAGDALAYANHGFDIILLDIMLPDVNGIDFCSTLRHWNQCPIIFITCLDDDETLIHALGMGGDDYLVKPFSNQILLAKIEANLRRSRVQRAEAPASPLTCCDFELSPNQTLSRADGKNFAYPKQNIVCFSSLCSILDKLIHQKSCIIGFGGRQRR